MKTAKELLEEVLTKFGHLSQELADHCTSEVAKLEASDKPAEAAAPAAEGEAAPAQVE